MTAQVVRCATGPAPGSGPGLVAPGRLSNRHAAARTWHMGNNDGRVRSRPAGKAVPKVRRASLRRGDDTGASACAYHRGVPVAIAGGAFTRDGGAYDRSTLQLVFSTTKGITAIAVAICASRGLIDYDVPVAHVLAGVRRRRQGRGDVAQLLSHQRRAVHVDGLTLEQALDWDTVTRALAAATPEWRRQRPRLPRPDLRLAGRRARPAGRRSLARHVRRRRVVKPLGVELWIGLPESEHPRSRHSSATSRPMS